MGRWIEDGMAAQEGVTYPMRVFDVPRLRRAMHRRMRELPHSMAHRDDFAGSPEAAAFCSLMADLDAELLDTWNGLQARMIRDFAPQESTVEMTRVGGEPCEMGPDTVRLFHAWVKRLADYLRSQALCYCFSQTTEYRAVESSIDRFADELAERFEPECSDFSPPDGAMREGRAPCARTERESA